MTDRQPTLCLECREGLIEVTSCTTASPLYNKGLSGLVLCVIVKENQNYRKP